MPACSRLPRTDSRSRSAASSATGSSGPACRRRRPPIDADPSLRDAAGGTGLGDLVALAERVQSICLERSLTLATAESCTGGLIGYALTEIAGSSEYYLGGVISYSNDAKREQLDVPAQTLELHGAVSAQTAVAMAEGARRRFAADIAVSVTGVAGPGGGSAAKPVGLVYVAVADVNGHEVRRLQRHGDRHDNRLASARASLGLLLERLAAS